MNEEPKQPSKTLYHSELVKLSPVQVTVQSDVLPSQFKGKPPFVVLLVKGRERNYSCENEGCEVFFDGQKGRSFTLIAAGRGAEATLTYVGEALPEQAAPPVAPPANRPPPPPPPVSPGAVLTPPPPQSSPPANVGALPARPAAPPKPPEQSDAAKLARCRQHANKLANCWLLAFAAASFARKQVLDQFGVELSQDQFQGCVTNLSIKMQHDGVHLNMPTGVLKIGPNSHAPPAPVAPAPQPEQVTQTTPPLQEPAPPADELDTSYDPEVGF
jgi:hypothetical protein